MLSFGKFFERFHGKDSIEINDRIDNEVFGSFIEFINSGVVPSAKGAQKGVIELMRQWDCADWGFYVFRHRCQCNERDGMIERNGNEYMINKLMMITNSKLYAKHYFEDIDLIFTINDEFSDEAFEAFLDMIHEKMLIPSLKLCCEVNQIAKMWNCEGIIVFFDEESNESILSSLLHYQNSFSFDSSYYEERISNEIKAFLKIPSFSKVSLSILTRIFQITDELPYDSSLFQFIKKIRKFHGLAAVAVTSVMKLPKKTSEIEYKTLYSSIFANENDWDQVIQGSDGGLLQKEINLLKTDLLKKEEEIKELKENFKEISKKSIRTYDILSTESTNKVFISNIHIAAYNGNKESIQKLITNGYNTNQLYNQKSLFNGVQMEASTPLHFAVLSGCIETIGILLNNGADINARNALYYSLFIN